MKNFFRSCSSVFIYPAVLAPVFFALTLAAATFIEKYKGSDMAFQTIYQAHWLEITLALTIFVILPPTLVRYRLFSRSKIPALCIHLAVGLILTGALTTRYTGYEGIMHLRTGNTSHQLMCEYGLRDLPFAVQLSSFTINRYPGSESPSDYVSRIRITDKTGQSYSFSISMNHTLDYRGYRFFQSSFDPDEKGSTLMVNHDRTGTVISYSGYFVLIVALIFSLFSSKGRFRSLLRQLYALPPKTTCWMLLALTLSCGVSAGATTRTEHLKQLSTLLISEPTHGRIEPFGVFARDLLRKINRNTAISAEEASGMLMSLCADPDQWKQRPLIKVGNKQLAIDLKATDNLIAFSQLVKEHTGDTLYLLAERVDEIYRKDPSTRSEYEKELLQVDERINILYELFGGRLLRIFPVNADSSGRWESVTPAIYQPTADKAIPLEKITDTHTGATTPSLQPRQLMALYLYQYKKAGSSSEWDDASTILKNIQDYQQANGDHLPSAFSIQLELLSEQIRLFFWLALLYVLGGMLILILFFYKQLRPASKWEPAVKPVRIFFIFLFIMHTAGLGIRAYISGHAPWSNGYETMLLASWATMLAGILFSRKQLISLALSAVLAAVALGVAGMSWMNPEITLLAPVLQSNWLVIHVAVITASYGFLGTATMLAIMNLILFALLPVRNHDAMHQHIRQLSLLTELSMICGLIMLVAGTIFGAVWANESWGKYWGWDAKETWALISILVYSTALHLRLIARCNNPLVLSLAALPAFATILMTFIGVNFYLSGIHAYGQQAAPDNLPALIGGCTLAMLALAIAAIRGARLYPGYQADNRLQR